MPAAVRYTWMFRTAAVVIAMLGASLLWRFGVTDYQPQYRPYGLIAGVFALAVAVFLLRRARVAIGTSAALSAFIAICATVAAPASHGPVILFFVVLAIVCGTYAVLAARVLFERES
jgi:hypothetical protein